MYNQLGNRHKETITLILVCSAGCSRRWALLSHTFPIYCPVTNILTGVNQYAGRNLKYLKLVDVCKIKILL